MPAILALADQGAKITGQRRPQAIPEVMTVAYQRRQRAKQSVLPDFYIGAHAAVSGSAILTRDVARSRTYFPTVNLIT